MKRLLAGVLLLAMAPSCADDRVTLGRGPLGPATYAVRLDVSGAPTVRGEAIDARLEVDEAPAGARLVLDVEGGEPVTAELAREDGGRLRLESVEGVSPGSAGEADLASLVGQLDPPLPPGPVRIGEEWTQTRRIFTETLAAELRTTLRITGFRRISGLDAVELVGGVSGTLEASGPAGVFDGTVQGTTRIAWALEEGRLAGSDTRLVWTIPRTGEVVLETEVRPA